MDKARSIILLVLVFFIGLFTSIFLNEVFGNYVFERPNPEEMSSDGYSKGFSANGYYCVITKGEGVKQIQNYDYHEACHELINNDYSHFCKR